MKLIQQFNTNTDLITENVDGQELKYVQGIYLMSEIKNKNGNYYSADVMEESVNRYIQSDIMQNTAVGEFNHPNPARPNMDYERACVRHVECVREGNNWIGKSLILDTTHGRQLKGLISGGVKVGTSSRVLAQTRMENNLNMIQMGMKMCTIGDIVSDPSAPEAFVNGIMESVDWVWKDGLYVESQLEQAVDVIKGTKSKDLPLQYQRMFNYFTSNLRND